MTTAYDSYVEEISPPQLTHSPWLCNTLPRNHLVLFCAFTPFLGSTPFSIIPFIPSLSGVLLKLTRALCHSLLIRELGCSGVICMKLEWPPPFGGVCGLGVPLTRDDDAGETAAAGGELPIGWCARRHDTDGGVGLAAEAGGACGEARIDDTRARSASRDVFGLCDALRARAREPGSCPCPFEGGRGGRGGRDGMGGRGGAMVRFC